MLKHIVTLLLISAPLISGHGWLHSPVPRGLGRSSADASTAASCSKGKTTGPAGNSTATVVSGGSLPVAYFTINGHGGSVMANDTNGHGIAFKLLMTSTGTFDPAQFAAGKSGFQTNANAYAFPGTLAETNPDSVAQTATLSMPITSYVGPAILQFEYLAVDASKWFDCADITIIAPANLAVCTNAATKCSDVCTPVNNAPVCSCNLNRFLSADLHTCNPLPPSTLVSFTVNQAFSPSLSGALQTNVTTILQQAFNLMNRINFQTTVFGTANTTFIFDVLSDPITGRDGMLDAEAIAQFVGQYNQQTPAQKSAFPYTPVGVSLNNQPAVLLNNGYTAPTTNPNTNASPVPPSMTGTIVGVSVVIGLLIALTFIGYKRGWHTSIAQKASKKNTELKASRV